MTALDRPRYYIEDNTIFANDDGYIEVSTSDIGVGDKVFLRSPNGEYLPWAIGEQHISQYPKPYRQMTRELVDIYKKLCDIRCLQFALYIWELEESTVNYLLAEAEREWEERTRESRIAEALESKIRRIVKDVIEEVVRGTFHS